MKRAVKIFALILAVAFCTGLFSCANSPVPPVVTNTESAETIGVPDTTAAPDTMGTPETAAPETKPAETTAPETKPVETIVPVTTPAVTTASETTQAPETTAAETESVSSFPISAFAESYYKDSSRGVDEPFYQIDETHFGVRGFDGAVLSTADGCYLSFDPSDLEGLPFDKSTVRYSFTEKPDLPLSQTDFCEHIDPYTDLLYLSDFCSLRVVCYGLFHNEYNGQTDECLFLIKHPEAYHFYLPISKSEDGRNVRYLQASCYSTGWIAFDVMDATLNEKLDTLAGLQRTFQLRDVGSCAGACFHGEYGLFLVDHGSGILTGEQESRSYYSLYATNDGGSSWIRFDPGNRDTPELVLKRQQNGRSTVIEKGKTDQ